MQQYLVEPPSDIDALEVFSTLVDPLDDDAGHRAGTVSASVVLTQDEGHADQPGGGELAR